MTLFRKRAQKRAASSQDFVDHSSLRQADPFEFQVAHRRLCLVLRLSVGSNIALLGAVLALGSALSALTPLKEVRLALLRVDPADQRLYRIEPIQANVEGFSLLLEQVARRYVRNILEIDPITQAERFREAARMTGLDQFERFKRERIDSGAIEQAHKDGLTRAIVTESANEVSSANGIYTLAVDFTQSDSVGGREIGRRSLRAYLRMTTRPREVADTDKIENPLGVVVLDMVVKERNA